MSVCVCLCVCVCVCVYVYNSTDATMHIWVHMRGRWNTMTVS